jgi:hypothetical protein
VTPETLHQTGNGKREIANALDRNQMAGRKDGH